MIVFYLILSLIAGIFFALISADLLRTASQDLDFALENLNSGVDTL